MPFQAKLIVAALAPDFRSSVQKYLDLGMRENNRADVAAFHYDTALSSKFLLLTDHPRANRAEDAHARCGLGDGRVADEAADVLAIEQNTILVFAGFEQDGSFASQALKCKAVVQWDFIAQRFKRERAVHCARFKIQQSEVPGQVASDGAFSRAGGAVDRHNDPAACFRRGHAVNFRAHPRFFVLCPERAVNP